MKKNFIAIYLLSITFLIGQDIDKKFSIGFNFGIREYNGSLGNGFLNYKNTYPSIGIWGNYFLNSFFDIGLNYAYGFYGHTFNDFLKTPMTKTQDTIFGKTFVAQMGNLNGLLKFKFNNGLILKENSFISPYLLSGIGYMAYPNAVVYDYQRYKINNSFLVRSVSERKELGKKSITLPLGFGISMKIEEHINLNVQVIHSNLILDKDRFLQYNLGFTVLMGKPKDSDKDGVPDKVDKCPNTPLGINVDATGCEKDSDGDGISDSQDECPDSKGIIKGCPDLDGDGIADKDDECINEAGLIILKGCPDTDGDGIKDSEDDCPTLVGIQQYKGCPDSDNDGFIDPVDECPSVAGTVKGCPDSDNDGIADKHDKCPTKPGLEINKGCPEIKREILNKVATLPSQIYFENGKDILKKESFKALNELAEILKTNPELSCEIICKSSAAIGRKLPQERANAIKNYLILKGVSSQKLDSKGIWIEQIDESNNQKQENIQQDGINLIVKY